MSKLPGTLPGRDDPHPRDTLLVFPDLPKKRRAGIATAAVPTVVKSSPSSQKQAKVGKRREKRRDMWRVRTPVQSDANDVTPKASRPAPNPPQSNQGAGKGRPFVSIAQGMKPQTLQRYLAAVDQEVSEIKRSMLSSFPSNLILVEYDALDPDLFNCWHFSRLDQCSRTLVDIGENAVSLVNSFPGTAAERTALRQSLTKSMCSVYFTISYNPIISD